MSLHIVEIVQDRLALGSANSTKDGLKNRVGSGRDRYRGGLPDFLKNRDRDWDEKKIPISIFGRDRGGLPD